MSGSNPGADGSGGCSNGSDRRLHGSSGRPGGSDRVPNGSNRCPRGADAFRDLGYGDPLPILPEHGGELLRRADLVRQNPSVLLPFD